ncbi:hypothetical protein [Saccharothrix yanglingensis]|uniref:SH3 domain-containing protein n=1 Tax=Saccharothrix yanglingensis TaxID=659496 RepID=A0ABU0WTQ9_9PSEU|nr:hypothetical protein [Saccharothrix yanglingensis]MDQ2583228.1 hypothetical protein [Saccharothrix yanglingensis]
MEFAKPSVAVALVVAGLFTGGTTAVAEGEGEVGAFGALYTVTTWHEVKIRTCPSSACSQQGSLHAGQSRKVECWAHGESITDAGITNDIWLQVDDADEDNGDLWSSAVYFVGDQYAGLPADARCADSPEPARR